VAYAPPLTLTWTWPAALGVEVCGAVQLAGTASLIAPLVAIPPVATVYVRTSVLAAEPAVAVVGLIEAVPEPSLDGFTVTLGEPEVSEVSAPPLVDFSCTVHVAGPESAACVAAAAPLELPEVSP